MIYKISKIIDESPRVRRFFLNPQEAELSQISYQPGQFIVLQKEAPIGEMPIQRSYSIASIATTVEEVELCIVLNEQGEFTPWLFSLSVGDNLIGSLPQGGFILNEPISEVPHVFVCTGTGVAPFRSMIERVIQKSQTEIYLIFGNRYEEDILYRAYFRNLEQTHNHFHFLPVLSREEAWSGHKGYVHECYQNILEGTEDARIYVCGWEDMCKDARKNLKTMGFNRRQYFFEQYD